MVLKGSSLFTLLSLFLLALLLTACQSATSQEQLMSWPYMTAKAPANWQLVALNGTDSDTWAIITHEKDTLFMDYGRYSDPFNYSVPVMPLERRRFLDSLHAHYSTNTIFSPDWMAEQDQAIFLREYFFYDTIDGRRAKIGLPKKVGTGNTLIHFPNVDMLENRLSIHGRDLDTAQQEAAYRLFQSIRFKTPRASPEDH